MVMAVTTITFDLDAMPSHLDFWFWCRAQPAPCRVELDHHGTSPAEPATGSPLDGGHGDVTGRGGRSSAGGTGHPRVAGRPAGAATVCAPGHGPPRRDTAGQPHLVPVRR